MEVYRRETHEIVRLFLGKRITQEQCAAALHAAFTGVLPDLKPEDLETLRAIVRDYEQAMLRRCIPAVN